MAKWNSFYANHPGANKDPLAENSSRDNPSIIRYWKGIFLLILILAIGIMGIVTYLLFHSFSDVILDTHRNNLMNITESAANNLEIYLRSFQVDTQSMLELTQFQEAEEACAKMDYEPMNRFLEEAISRRKNEIVYMSYYKSHRG